MNYLAVLPLVFQLYGPGPLAPNTYVVGPQWTAAYGAYTATTKTMWFGDDVKVAARWARFLVIWQPNSCSAKVRLIARDATGRGLPPLVLGQVEACGQNAGGATPDRIHMPDLSGAGITETFNQAIWTMPGFYVGYEVQDDGVHPIGFWEVRLELFLGILP